MQKPPYPIIIPKSLNYCQNPQLSDLDLLKKIQKRKLRGEMEKLDKIQSLVLLQMKKFVKNAILRGKGLFNCSKYFVKNVSACVLPLVFSLSSCLSFFCFFLPTFSSITTGAAPL